MNKYFNTMFTLISMLCYHNIPFNFKGSWRNQVTFPWCIGDVICIDDKFVESYGFPWDEGDVSNKTPQDMFILIKTYYKQVQQEIKKGGE